MGSSPGADWAGRGNGEGREAGEHVMDGGGTDLLLFAARQTDQARISEGGGPVVCWSGEEAPGSV